MNGRWVGRTGATALTLAAAVALAGCSGGSSGADVAATTSSPAVATSTATQPATTTSTTTPVVTPSTSLPTSVAQVITVSVAKGKVTGPKGRVKVKKNSEVQIVVTSDVADEIHLHGYDKSVDAEVGVPTALTFKATIAGVFEVELESKALRLLQLQVA